MLAYEVAGAGNGATDTARRARRGNPGYSQANVLTGHRASSRPYNPAPKPIFKGKGLIGGMSSGVKGRRLRVRVVMPWYPAVAAMTTSAKSGE